MSSIDDQLQSQTTALLAHTLLDEEDRDRLLSIRKLRTNTDLSWSDIEAELDTQSLYHWTTRKLKLISKATDEEIEHAIRTAKNYSSDSKQSNKNGFRGTQTQSQFQRDGISKIRASGSDNETDKNRSTPNVVLPDYGELEPTGYVSPLSIDAWMERYAGYSIEWRNPYLTRLRNRVWNKMKLLILEPRGHGKTWSLDALFARWILERGGGIQCYTNAGKKDEIFRMVLRILKSDAVRQDYGDVVATSRENKGEIWLLEYLRYNSDGSPIEGADFRVIGKAASSVGGHPAWIHLEDVVQEMSLSEMTNLRVNRWFESTVKYMRKKDTKITLTGTRKDVGDFYEFVEETMHFPVLKEEAITVESGRFPSIDEVVADHERDILVEWDDVGVYRTLNCPDWPLERLLYEYVFHYKTFEAEMQNNPLPSQGLYFPSHSFKVIEPFSAEVNYYIVIDPGFSKSRKSSGSAIIVVCTYMGKMAVVDALIDKLSSGELDNHVIDLHHQWEPRQTIVEDNYAQISKNQDTDFKLMKLRGLKLITNYTDKYERIAGLDRPFARNQIVWYETCSFLDKFEQQILTFDPYEPGNDKKPFNALDVLMMAWDHLMPFVRRGQRQANKTSGGLNVGTRRSIYR